MTSHHFCCDNFCVTLCAKVRRVPGRIPEPVKERRLQTPT